jgi:SAM-dependent methyltransferase
LRTLISSLVLCAGIAAGAQAQSWAWDDGTTPFVVTPEDVVERMMRLAEPRAGDYLIDLGSGDGRIVIEAARRAGTRGLGVDIDPHLVGLARDNARKVGVESLAKFEVRDLFETDVREATIVTMYLLPEVNRKLAPRLYQQLRPGARIVSHDYELGDWSYDEMIELAVPDKMIGPQGRSKVYLWVVPEDARGAWSFDLPQLGGQWQLRIEQSWQLLEVDARLGGGSMLVRGARLRGHAITVPATGMLGRKAVNLMFRGRLAGDRIEGRVRVSDGENFVTHPWSATRRK